MLGVLLLSLVVTADSGIPSPGEIATAHQWADENLHADKPGPYVIKPDALGAPTPGTSGDQAFACGLQRSVIWRYAGAGLDVRAEAVVYNDFPAVEWVLYIKNTAAADSPLIDYLHALDCRFPAAEGDPVLHYAKGATCSAEDFRPMTRRLNTGAEQHFQPGGGRSSSMVMPFFNLELEPGRGVIAAIGWSGEWYAGVHRDTPDKSARLHAGMLNFKARLHAGEEVRSPRILLLFYQGDTWLRGQNLLRQFILKHARPAPGGKPLEPILFNSNWGGTAVADHLANVRAINEQRLPFNAYWIDAEWFGQGPWHVNAGDWRVKQDLYPEGFKPLSDALHGAGRKFLLWFEPERVCEGTPWQTELASWLLEIPKEKRAYNWGTSQHEPAWVEWESNRNQIKDGDRLFNLGNPEARQYLTDFVSARIQEFGLDLFRHDANIAPLEFWNAADEADRKGMTEIRWVEGLYAFWDELLRRHPHLGIDNCASGGRRIDLETLRRATPYWRTDYPASPAVKQCHSYGAAFWTPITATGNVNPAHADDYAWRSTWAGSLCCELFGAREAAQALAHPASFPFEKVRAALDAYHAVKEFYLGDYYPLTEYSQAEDAWMAWQFDRPDLGAGMVQVFRRPGSLCETGRIRFHGLEPDAVYTLTGIASAQTATGRTLADEGLALTLAARPDSAVIVYKKTP